MAKEIELVMPKMGESIAEATILKWLKQEGDKVELDEAILEIATDKVDSEVPSPSEGVIGKILFAEGDVVKVGEVIATIRTGAGGEEETKAPAPAAAVDNGQTGQPQAQAQSQPQPAMQESSASQSPQPVSNSGSRFYSPLVLNIAKEEDIGMAELEAVEGTGKEGRVTKKDILAYVERRKEAPASRPAEAQPQTKPQAQPAAQPQTLSQQTSAQGYKVDVPVFPGDEIVEMDRMRKLIADHMVMSKHVSPHVTSFVEADVTNIVQWRERNKKEFEKREGTKITFTPIFIEAVVKALKDFPGVNVSVSGNQIIKRKNINIGMAAALPSGNLIVPVIKNADELSLVGLAKRVNDLADRARANQLKPDEIQGGTFTITNVGTFGNVMGTPVINQPQVAILAVGAIRKKPVVIETENGDFIGIRQMMFLSLSYDHRVVDGMLGGSFLRRIADYMEGFDPKRTL